MVPLLEIVERTGRRTVDSHLTTSFKNLASSLQGYARCLLDVREIEADGQAAATEVFARALREGIPFTPITGVSRTVDVAPAIAHSANNGIGIRLTRDEFEAGVLSAGLNRFMSSNNLSPGNVDLISRPRSSGQPNSCRYSSAYTGILSGYPVKKSMADSNSVRVCLPNEHGSIGSKFGCSYQTVRMASLAR